MTLKFTPLTKKDGLCVPGREMPLSELIKSGSPYDAYLQYQGFQDADKNPVYEGDLLELKITDELMDSRKDLFYNSNLGINLKKHPKVISVLCHIEHNTSDFIGCHYGIYYMDRERGIVAEDATPEISVIAMGCDCNFPIYLCQKGAVRIANTVTAPDNVLEHIAEYTGFTPYAPIPQHAVMNGYGL